MQRWTAEEIAVLKANYGTTSLAEIGRMVGRSKNSVAAKVKSLRLNRPDRDAVGATLDGKPKAPDGDPEEQSRLSKLIALRERMERAIEDDVIPFMQQPAYYREYRALLADIDELEHDDGNTGSDGDSGQSFAETLDKLVDLQRDILDRAREP